MKRTMISLESDDSDSSDVVGLEFDTSNDISLVTVTSPSNAFAANITEPLPPSPTYGLNIRKPDDLSTADNEALPLTTCSAEITKLLSSTVENSKQHTADDAISPEILAALEGVLEEYPEFGPNIHKTLSYKWNLILRNGLGDEDKLKLYAKYTIPSNCRLLQAPKLNTEVSTAITKEDRDVDKNTEKIQQQLGLGIAAINKGLNLFISDGSKLDAIKALSDGCRLLCDVHYQDTQNRRDIISKKLNNSFFCQMQERDETLFGNTLSKRMKNSNKLTLVTYNCKNIKKSVDQIREFCTKAEIIALQETWLNEYELKFPDFINDYFECFSKSSLDASLDIRRLRGYGGLTIMWSKPSFTDVSVVNCKSDRLVAIKMLYHRWKLLVLNVYMPVDNQTSNDNEFMTLLENIKDIVENYVIDVVFILGDFNADPRRLRFDKMMSYCKDKKWFCVDVDILGRNSNTSTFTSSNGTQSWLDHCLTNEAGRNAVTEVNVKTTECSDHNPVYIHCEFPFKVSDTKVQCLVQERKS